MQPALPNDYHAAWDRRSVEDAVDNDDVSALPHAIVAAVLNDHDWHYLQDLCIRMSAHTNYSVLGVAILGFGHIARIHQELDQELVQPIISSALRHTDSYVRGQAQNAADDTGQFLGWHYD